MNPRPHVHRFIKVPIELRKKRKREIENQDILLHLMRRCQVIVQISLNLLFSLNVNEGMHDTYGR